MKKFVSLVSLLFAFTLGAKEPLVISEQGSFAFGGTVLTDSSGHKYHGDHGYVFYQLPADGKGLPIVMAHGVGQFSKTWETTPDGREGFQNIFLRKGYPVFLVDQPRRGNAGRSTEAATITPTFDEEVWFNRFRVGVWPEYFEGVQFDRSPETLNQYFRQMTPTIGSVDFDVYSNAYAALFDSIGPGIFFTHSQGGPVGWRTLRKTDNIRAIVSYEPGGEIPFPIGQVPAEGKVLTLSKKTEGVEIPMDEFLKYTRIPILIYYGDNLPDTDERPEIYEWTRRLHLMRLWAKLINDNGGDCTVIHLPEIGFYGNTHFIMSDLNNEAIANHTNRWLQTHLKGKPIETLQGEKGMTCRIQPISGDTIALLGYGCMRWPMKDGVVLQDTVNALVDYAIAHGVNYFDVSPAYLGGKSEPATGIALSRHPRNSYFIADKMSNHHLLKSGIKGDSLYRASIELYHNSQKYLRTDTFDYYLIHTADAS